MFLFGMLAIRLHIGDIVEQIDRAGDQAKQKETFKRFYKCRGMKQLFVEDQREEDKAVLCPLAGAHGFY